MCRQSIVIAAGSITGIIGEEGQEPSQEQAKVSEKQEMLYKMLGRSNGQKQRFGLRNIECRSSGKSRQAGSLTGNQILVL